MYSSVKQQLTLVTVITTIHFSVHFHLPNPGLYQFTNNSPFLSSPKPQPRNCHLLLCVYEFCSFKVSQVSGVTLLLSFCDWFISLSIISLGSSILQYLTERPYFLRPCQILLCIYTTFCLFIYLLLDTWISSTFWLLCIQVAMNLGLQISVEILLSILLSMYSEVELLSHIVTLCLIF